MPLKSSSGWLVPSLFLTSLVFGSLPHPTAAAQDIGVEKLPFCDDDSVTSQSGAANRGNSDRNFGKRYFISLSRSHNHFTVYFAG